jgi:S-adenosylmethionine:tRNA ribosyltransferase-isomerase
LFLNKRLLVNGELHAKEFSIGDLDYHLPKELIAHAPLPRRDDSRLLVVNRQKRSLQDATMRDFPSMLNGGDLLVLNDTRVLPARFTAFRETGGRVGGLFLEEERSGQWRAMLEGSRRLRIGETIRLGADLNFVDLTLVESLEEGQWRIKVGSSEPATEILERFGQTPLPPYINREGDKRDLEKSDRDRYQTVYARVPGAVAAPTAGLHLSVQILAEIRDRGVSIAYVTLHVGPGTFKPISAERLADHVMHYEHFEIPDATVLACKNCRARGGRVVAVGTTVVRALESVMGGEQQSAKIGSTNLFIYPPYRVTAVDALLTNFHLPRSTLLALVMAFAGIDLTREAYRHAIEKRYRFYSYGDAMFIA